MSGNVDIPGNEPNAPKASHRGCAPQIRALASRYPEMTAAAIARTVGCTTSNVYNVLDTFLAGTSRDSLQSFQENKADIYDALQYRLLGSLTDEKILKAKPMEIITGAAILEDKSRLVRGQATGINVTVLMDVVDAIRNRPTAQVVDSKLPTDGV
jgi:hypothetical protein